MQLTKCFVLWHSIISLGNYGFGNFKFSTFKAWNDIFVYLLEVRFIDLHIFRYFIFQIIKHYKLYFIMLYGEFIRFNIYG